MTPDYTARLKNWWWSPAPFEQYQDAQGRGLATLVERHPGLFNLAWALHGAPTRHIQVHDRDLPFGVAVLMEMPHIPHTRSKSVRLARTAFYTIADAAFELKLTAFLKEYRASKLAAGWKFHDPRVTHTAIVRRLERAAEGLRNA
jgi:hypothetical protein